VFQLLKQYSPFGLVISFIAGMFLWFSVANNYQLPSYHFNGVQMPVFRYLYDFVFSFRLNWISTALTLVLIIIQVFFLSSLDFSYNLSKNRGFATAFIFVILISANPSVTTLLPSHFANIFIILALNRIFDSYKKEVVLYHYFDAALLLSIGGIFYFYTWLLFPFLLLSISLLKAIRLKEFLISITGFITPIVFYIGFYYAFSSDFLTLATIKSKSTFWLDTHLHNLYFMAVLTFFIGTGTVYVLRKYTEFSLSQKAFFRILFLLFVTGIFSVSFINFSIPDLTITISVPISILLSFMFNNIKSKLLSEIYFLIFIVLFTATHAIKFYLG